MAYHQAPRARVKISTPIFGLLCSNAYVWGCLVQITTNELWTFIVYLLLTLLVREQHFETPVRYHSNFPQNIFSGNILCNFFMVDVRIDNPFRRRAVLKLKIFNVQIIVLAKHIIFSNREVSSLHPFSKLRVLSEKYSYFKCQF